MVKLYENIKFYRKQHNWSQEELAKKMGYTDRSMIAKIESGKVDLAQSKIIDFAHVFGVDPGDLMGWGNTEEYLTIGQRIKKRREELNISQTDLALMVDISKQTLYKYENDIITNIPSDKIQSISKALDVTPAYLMGWEDTSDNLMATRLYDLYTQAPPEIQAAVETLLKATKSDS